MNFKEGKLLKEFGGFQFFSIMMNKNNRRKSYS